MNSVIQFANEPREVPEFMPVHQAAQKMGQWHVGSLVVTRSGEAVGLVTDRDLMLHGILGTRSDPTVCDCMSTPLITIAGSASLVEAVQMMHANSVRRLGVRGQSGALAGVITADDLWRHLGQSMGYLATTIKREFRAEEHPSEANGSLFGKE